MNYGKLTVGANVVFDSKSNKDNVKYKGRICSLMNYRMAKAFGDLVSYNEEVRHTDPKVGEVEELSYFLVELDRSDNPNLPKYDKEPPNRVFAYEWIAPGSLQILKSDSTTTIVLYGASDKVVKDIEDVIRSTGIHYSVSEN